MKEFFFKHTEINADTETCSDYKINFKSNADTETCSGYKINFKSNADTETCSGYVTPLISLNVHIQP